MDSKKELGGEKKEKREKQRRVVNVMGETAGERVEKRYRQRMMATDKGKK